MWGWLYHFNLTYEHHVLTIFYIEFTKFSILSLNPNKLHYKGSNPFFFFFFFTTWLSFDYPITTVTINLIKPSVLSEILYRGVRPYKTGQNIIVGIMNLVDVQLRSSPTEWAMFSPYPDYSPRRNYFLMNNIKLYLYSVCNRMGLFFFISLNNLLL